MSKHRNWVFTLNNYTTDEHEQLQEFRRTILGGDCEERQLGIKYICFQPERGLNGTPHLQGVLICKNPRALGGMRQLLERAHWEPMRGSLQQAIEYCSKEETRDTEAGFGFTEAGDRPNGAGVPGSRSDLSEVTTAIKSGQSAEQIFDQFGEQYLKYYKGIERAIGFFSKRRTWKTTVHWFYGPTGTGKTRTAFENCPLAYFKSASNHWWDGYHGQETVIIDDYRADFCKFSALLRLFDRYPLSVEVKGGTVEFLAKDIYITTPHSPERTWASRTNEEIGQLTRRIEDIQNFEIYRFLGL